MIDEDELNEWADDYDQVQIPMVQLVNAMIDNCVEEQLLGNEFCERVRGMDRNERNQVCDMIYDRILNDPTARLGKAERDTVWDEMTEMMEDRISSLLGRSNDLSF